jgi:hypothetical protein
VRDQIKAKCRLYRSLPKANIATYVTPVIFMTFEDNILPTVTLKQFCCNLQGIIIVIIVIIVNGIDI